MKHLTDEQLMLCVRQGDLKKLALLFERHHKHLYNFYRKMTLDSALSEDLTQEVFEKILKYRTSYQEGNFQSWMFTIARNIFSSHYQKNKKMGLQSVHSDELAKIPLVTPLDRDEEIAHLLLCLQHLTPADRELIILHRLQEIGYEQLAHITGSSAGALKVKMHRALKKLRSAFFNHQPKGTHYEV